METAHLAAHPDSGRRRASSRVAAAAVAACVLLLNTARAQDAADDPIGKTRTTLEKWVETRRIISQEKRDWDLGREMLTDRVELMRREIESFRARIEEAEKSIGEADRKKAELVARNDELVAGSTALNQTVLPLETGTRELLKLVPDPIRERVKPLSQRLPESPETTQHSLSERFQNIVGLLNEVNRFNREITVTSEVRTLGDGSKAEVTAMYLGLGQGYYTNTKGTAAGVGTATPEGWTWTAADDAAERITNAIAVFRNERPAEFVKLPIRLN